MSSEHVPRLVRTDSVVREALRLYPVTGAVGRTLRKPVVLEGYEIPAGVMIAPNFSLLHRRPEIYPDPHTFQPERFIGKKVDPYEWMPFGAGAHRCLGMHFALFEMKVILASLFAEAEIEAVSPNKALVGLRSFVLSPKGNTPVRVKNIYQPVDLSAARPADAPSLRFRSSNTPSILRSGSRSGA